MEKNQFKFEHLENDSLIDLRMRLDAELDHRGINFSVGSIGEQVAISHFNSTPCLPNLKEAAIGVKNVDALSRDGERYSIKTQIKAKKTGTIYPDSEKPDKVLFEYLLIVKLTPAYQLESLHQFSWEDFVEVRAWDKRMNAWYVPINQKRLLHSVKLHPTTC